MGIVRQIRPNLESLDLREDKRQAAKRQIELRAYFEWKQAGCPVNAALQFWLAAEQVWIENQYIPDRYPVGSRDR